MLRVCLVVCAWTGILSVHNPYVDVASDTMLKRDNAVSDRDQKRDDLVCREIFKSKIVNFTM